MSPTQGSGSSLTEVRRSRTVELLPRELSGELVGQPGPGMTGHRRVKNDLSDAEDLADLLRLGRLAEAWVAPPEIRELRELVRYRAKLGGLRCGLGCQVHAVLAKEGVNVVMSDLFGVAVSQLLDTVPLGDAYTVRVESLRDLLEIYDREIAMLDSRSLPASTATRATTPSRPFPGSARSWLRCWWPRSAT
jgi:hypothetical protein